MAVTMRGFGDPQTQGEMQKANPGNFMPRLPRIPKPDYFIYLHSVAKRGFRVHHVFCKGELPGCKPGQRFVTCARLTEPAIQIAPDESNGGQRLYDDNGWRVAIDILNPNNPTTDPYWENRGALGAFFGTSANSNLIAQGLFPSLNEVPTEEELERAETTRDNRYRQLVDEALRLEGFSQKQLQDFIQDQPDVHPAMDALGLEAPWHKKHDIRRECPNCGDSIKAGIAFHRSTAGVLCIIDAERAAKAGVGAATSAPAAGFSDETDSDWQAQRRGPGRPRKDSGLA